MKKALIIISILVLAAGGGLVYYFFFSKNLSDQIVLPTLHTRNPGSIPTCPAQSLLPINSMRSSLMVCLTSLPTEVAQCMKTAWENLSPLTRKTMSPSGSNLVKNGTTAIL